MQKVKRNKILMIHSAKMIHISSTHIPDPQGQHNITPNPRLEPNTTNLFPFRLLPIIIPPLSRGRISLHASILDREHISKDTLLVHRHAEQLATITSTSAQLFAGLLHTLILTHQLEFLLTALLRLEQLPGAMDGPVAEIAVTGEAEGTGGKRVVKEVADHSWK